MEYVIKNFDKTPDYNLLTNFLIFLANLSLRKVSFISIAILYNKQIKRANFE
jgi:hypothetical protein